MATGVDQSAFVTLRFARLDARRAFVLGSFNGWNPHANPMQRMEDGVWCCELRLAPGAYQFQFLADVSTAHACDAAEPTWWNGNLEFVIVTPRGGTFTVSTNEPGYEECNEDARPCGAIDESEGPILPLSRIERELVLGFRKLPDHESRAAFLDVLQESVYS